MVGVSKTTARDVDGVIHRQAMSVHQDAHEFRPGNRGVGVIQLDRDEVGEGADVVVILKVPTYQVLDRRGGEEVFLLEPEFLAVFRRIVGIQNPADRARQSLGSTGGKVISPVEALEIEFLRGLGRPEAQRVAPGSLPSDDRRVIGRCHHDFFGMPIGLALVVIDVTAETHGVARFGAFKFPRVALCQPCFRLFDLLSMIEALLEQPVFVADTVPKGRDAHGRHRVHEARGQSTQAAIAQRRIRFVVNDRIVILTQLRDRCFHFVFELQIRDHVFDQPANQELHRQVIDALGRFGIRLFRRPEPCFDHLVAHDQRHCNAPIIQRRMFRVLAKCVFQLVQNFGFQAHSDASHGQKSKIALTMVDIRQSHNEHHGFGGGRTLISAR